MDEKRRRVQRRRFCPGLKLTRDPSVSFFLSCRGLCRSLSVESRRRTLNELRCDSIIFPDTHTHVRRRASATAIELADFSFQRSKEDESQDQKTRWRSLSFLFSLIPSSRSIRSCEGDWRAVGQKYFSIPKGKSRPSSLFLFSSSFGFWLRLSALLLSWMERERGFDCAVAVVLYHQWHNWCRRPPKNIPQSSLRHLYHEKKNEILWSLASWIFENKTRHHHQTLWWLLNTSFAHVSVYK
jgi:hypothetical protein